MSEIKALEDMRNTVKTIAADCDEGWILGCLDAIEAEIAERFMELPVDADGVPIRIGDTVCEVDVRVPIEVMSLTFYEDCVDVNVCGMNPNMLRHVKPRTLEDVMSEYAELSASQDVKKYHEVSDELREIQREQFRDEPERELFKEFNGYEFYIELPYDELCIGTEKAWVKRHSYSYMYRKPDGGTVYSCSSLCGYSRDWAIGRINEEIARIESELQMRGDAE